MPSSISSEPKVCSDRADVIEPGVHVRRLIALLDVIRMAECARWTPPACIRDGLCRGVSVGLKILSIMRWLQRQSFARLFVAMLFAAALSSLLIGRAPVALAVLLFIVLTLVGFVALTIAPDAIALQRRHYWRWWWRSTEEDGWAGTASPTDRAGHTDGPA